MEFPRLASTPSAGAGTRMRLSRLLPLIILMSPLTAVAQSLSFSPSALSFATQVVGETSAARSIVVTNTSGTAVTITSVAATSSFQETNNCTGVPVAPSATCEIRITFNPSVAATVTGALVVNNGVASQILNLSGVGVLPAVLFPGAAYLSASVGGTSSTTTFTLINYGSVPLAISNVVTSGGFSQTNTCGSSLAARGICAINVNFVPKASGGLYGALTIVDGSAFSPQVALLYGSASGSVTPTVTFSPTVLKFNSQLVGTASVQQVVTVTNKGTSATTVNGVAASGNYNQTSTCQGTVLAVGGTCTVTVSFDPTNTGEIPGAITVQDSAPTSPHVLRLSGTGIAAVTFSVPDLNFGGQWVAANIISSPRSAVLTNNSGAPLTISEVVASTGYRETDNCRSAPLPPGGTCTVSVGFSPTRTGSLNGSLTVATSASRSPLVLNLYGIGVRSLQNNPMQIENQKAGDNSWLPQSIATQHEIEGFASATSINRGESISFFVNTSDPTYTMDIYRIGWYGGAQARRMLPTITLASVPQPPPTLDPTTLLVECPWSQSYLLTVPANPTDPTDWLSGVYVVKLTGSTSKKNSYIIFVVRDDSRKSDLLMQSSVDTYEAYNTWGGYSLYTSPRAYKVSFNRPYTSLYWSMGDFIRWEINMVNFLEREGYDVTYSTDVDTHASGAMLLNHKAFLSVGHDEYWSWQMRDNAEAARNAGINLGFIGSNIAIWQVRFEPSSLTGVANRTIVCYKDAAADPYFTDGIPDHQHLVTVRFRDPPVNRPENTMIGVMYVENTVNSFGDMVVADASSYVFQNTGLQNGDHLYQLLGYEVDSLFPGTPTGTDVLANSPYLIGTQTLFANMTHYSWPSGSSVVATGSMQWNWGLDDFVSNGHPMLTDPAVQQATRSILRNWGVSPAQ